MEILLALSGKTYYNKSEYETVSFLVLTEEQIMSDFLTSNTMLMLQRSMNFLWTKQTAISDNIANAETPNYKTKYVTFEEALQSSLRMAAQQGSGSVGAMRSALNAAAPAVHVAGASRKSWFCTPDFVNKHKGTCPRSCGPVPGK